MTAIPAVGLCKGAQAAPGDDPLLEIVSRYRAEIAAINASHDLTDEELDEWVDKADAMLLEAYGLPVLTAASAAAVIDLMISQGLITATWTDRDGLVALAKSTRDYIASTA
jgi:hypothetical protein